MINFDAFKLRDYRNGWIREPGISIYVRKSWRTDIDYELANMNASIPGRKSLTKFLDRYEPLHRFYIEQILNPRLVPYFERRGYIVVGDYGVPHMVKPA